MSNSVLQWPDGTSPYLDGRREWMERYGDYIRSAHQWRLVGIGSLLITAFAVAGMVFSATQNHFIPYIVQVDRMGAVAAVDRADVGARPDTRIVRAQLARWINNVRSVYVDAAAERTVIDESYAMISRSGSAFNVINQFFRDPTPFQRAEKETVTIDVKTVLPVSGSTWRVEWTETTRSRNGDVQKTDEWQASITVLISPPADEVAILKNPLGIYIIEFSWTKQAT